MHKYLITVEISTIEQISFSSLPSLLEGKLSAGNAKIIKAERVDEECSHELKPASKDGDFVCSRCGREFCATPNGLQPKAKK